MSHWGGTDGVEHLGERTVPVNETLIGLRVVADPNNSIVFGIAIITVPTR